MSQFLDFLPILVFAGVFFATDIFYATGALMVAVALQVAFYWLAKKPISRELKLTFWASMIFGALTLLYRDEAFIQWKPTVINTILGVSLIVSQFVGKRNLVARMMGPHVELPDPEWKRLNYGWACGFFLAAGLNLLVAYNFTMEVWVTYKLVGGMGLTMSYIVITLVYLSKKGYLDQPQSQKD
ncbi:MAG: septation protein IspZ [Proteobacteria bacterium]|nr:septation protein IspZ [Pseudomonadota bacterium]